MNRLGLNKIASQEIFKDFIGGKIINKYELVDDRLHLSKRFTDLVNNIDVYKEFYQYLGFDLISVGADAYYISRGDRVELNDQGAQVQVILIVLSRGLISKGISPDILKDSESGISEVQINGIGEEEEYSRILRSCGINLQPFVKSVISIMVDRGLMYKTKTTERFCLSCSGKHLYDKIFIIDDTNTSGPNEEIEVVG